MLMFMLRCAHGSNYVRWQHEPIVTWHNITATNSPPHVNSLLNTVLTETLVEVPTRGVKSGTKASLRSTQPLLVRFPTPLRGRSYFSHSFQDEKNLNLRCHTSQTVTRISVASGDTSSRLLTLQIEQQIQAEYTFLSIFPINLMQLLPSMNADVL